MESAGEKPNLEDYILDMQTRPVCRNVSDADIWTQLQQKEADILLAAELGKALLEKNQDLTRQQEKLIEEYSRKLEALEQEKHMLRQRLSIVEEESEQRILELQADINELREKLEAQENAIRQAEREKALLIDELTSQNARLTAQIQQAHIIEAKLNTQLNQVKEQYSLRNSSLQDHVNSLEIIKDELKMVTEKRLELEKRLQTSQEEKQMLTAALEEASDRIHLLERHVREQETKLKASLHTLDCLHRENNTLTERLESMNCQDYNSRSSSYFQGQKSLLHEMECDDECTSGSVDSGDANQLLKEMQSVYKQLKCLYNSLKTNYDDDSGLHSDLSFESTENTLSTNKPEEDIRLRPGMLSAITDDVTRLILGLDTIHFKDMLEQARALIFEQEDDLKKKQKTIADLESKLSITEVQLKSVEEERDQARNDISQNNSAQDELVQQARNDRDAAVARRAKIEMDLAKTRVELMQASSQLLEAIQQKIELSQQLEQWQMDMQELIDEQMKSKLSVNKHKPQNIAPLSKKTIYRLWNLFQR